MLIGSAPELDTFAFVARILVEGLQPLVQHWSGMLKILAIASMALGNISAIAQTNLKRMFVYAITSVADRPHTSIQADDAHPLG